MAMLKHKGRQMAAETVPTIDNNVVELAADIVSAYVSNNSVPTGDLPALINEVHAALKRAGTPAAADAPRGEPAVPIKKSITPDYLISLFDGKKYKSLKRHLRTSHNMTPQEYRTFWNLAPDYPMVAPVPPVPPRFLLSEQISRRSGMPSSGPTDGQIALTADGP